LPSPFDDDSIAAFTRGDPSSKGAANQCESGRSE
jgi:hypothetical protein